MKLPKLEDCTTDFQRNYCYGDDTRQFFNPYPRKPGPFSYHLRLGSALEAFQKYLPAPANVADLACAAGNFALSLAERGYRVTAVDLIPDFLEYAKKKYTHGDINFVVSNLMDYQHPTPLDGILMGEVIEHVAWPEHLIASAHRNLRAGGIFVVTTPNGEYGGNDLPTFADVTKDRKKYEAEQFDPSHHLFLYTPQELRGLLEAGGFEVLEVRVFNSHYVTKTLSSFRYLLPQRALRKLDNLLSPRAFLSGNSANMMLAVGKKK